MGVESESRSWHCLSCMHLNLPDAAYCQLCRNINPVSAEARTRLPYWYCHHCFTGNPQERSYCRGCHTIRRIKENGSH